MSISTWIRYLLGGRRAIVEVAHCRQAICLGLLFVFSAGFAREYDGEDLWHEPWHVLIPLGASLVTSYLLFGLLKVAFGSSDTASDTERNTPDAPERSGQHGPATGERVLGDSLPGYRAFLGLYWMTAPLAWLYAIPFERFLDPAGAVRANLWLLAIVSVWRVALITRVASVLYTRSPMAAFFVVMLFADSVAMAVFWLTPLPIVSFMGGIRLTESERLIQDVGFVVRFLGTVSWPVWLIGAAMAMGRGRRDVAPQEDVPTNASGSSNVSWGLWMVSVFSLLIWAAILPFTQGEQIHRRRVETDLRAGRIAEAVQYMSRHDRDAFPPHWDPPPRLGYGESQPPIQTVLLHSEKPSVAPWVRDLFREKLVVQSQADPSDHFSHAIKLRDMDDERLASYAQLLESIPIGPALARYHATEIRASFEPDAYGSESVELSEDRRALLTAILRLVPEEIGDTNVALTLRREEKRGRRRRRAGGVEMEVVPLPLILTAERSSLYAMFQIVSAKHS